MSKVLVVYATKSGCTTGVAESIAATLTDQGIDVDLATAAEAGDPTGYDAVIVGSGVRAGTWHEAARSWVLANAAQLASMPVALFTCGMMIADGPERTDQVRAYTDALIAQAGIEPVDIGLFAGWNEPHAWGFFERSVMKVMKTPQGDFRDFAAIGDWTVATARSLRVA